LSLLRSFLIVDKVYGWSGGKAFDAESGRGHCSTRMKRSPKQLIFDVRSGESQRTMFFFFFFVVMVVQPTAWRSSSSDWNNRFARHLSDGDAPHMCLVRIAGGKASTVRTLCLKAKRVRCRLPLQFSWTREAACDRVVCSLGGTRCIGRYRTKTARTSEEITSAASPSGNSKLGTASGTVHILRRPLAFLIDFKFSRALVPCAINVQGTFLSRFSWPTQAMRRE